MDILMVISTSTTTAVVQLGDAERFAEGYTISLYNSDKTAVLATAVTKSTTGYSEPVAIFTGLTPDTTYYAYYVGAGYAMVETLPDSPKTALQSQWEDLASRFKALEARVSALENANT